MKFMISCSECMENDSRATLQYVPFQEGPLYDLTCEYGHRRNVVLQGQPFEVLYQIGSNAIIDGYYREAVSSFAASLERFYEFSVYVLLRARDLDHPEIAKAWKAIGNRSERQAGAFAALWFAQFTARADMLSDDQVKFRNNVVHNGMIPTRFDAIKFGQGVLDLIRPQQVKLKSALQAQITDIVGRRNGSAMRSVEPGLKVSLTDTPSAVSLSSDSPQPDSLAEIIEQMQANRRTFEAMAAMLKQGPPKITAAQ